MAVPSADFGYRSNPGLEDRLTGLSYDGLLLFGRVLMALIFVQSGFGKLLDIDGFTASLAGKGVPLAGIFGVIGPGVEFFGGLAVLFGLQTRYAAVLMLYSLLWRQPYLIDIGNSRLLHAELRK